MPRGTQAAKATLVGQDVAAVEEQFQLGIEDLLAGRYDLAQQRFEYVLSHDPGRSDAAELLDRALTAMQVPTRTPGPTATPITPTPTLDVGSLDVLFRQAQAAFAAGDWGRVLEASLLVRAGDPHLHRDEINALLAQSLRARGVQRILAREFEAGDVRPGAGRALRPAGWRGRLLAAQRRLLRVRQFLLRGRLDPGGRKLRPAVQGGSLGLM